MDHNIDVKKLLVEVGKIPLLWHPSFKKYIHKNEKMKAWHEICKKVYLQYQEKTEEGQRAICKYDK